MSKLDALLSLEYGEPLPAERRTGHGFPVFGSNGEVGRHRSALIAGPGIVVGRKGSVGKVTWSDENFWPIDTTYWVNCPPEERRWVYWVLSWLPLHLLDTSTGIPGLNRRDVYELEVYRPEFGERRKIAQILDTFDTAIRETEALIDKLKAVKQGLLHDLLTRGIDSNGQLRPPQSEAPQLYKESPLGWIPREWQCTDLAKRLARITYGFTSPMPTTDEGPWMLTATDVSESRILYEQARHTTERAFRLLSAKSRPNVGDVLVTKDGTLGRVAVLDRDDVCVNQSVAVLSPKTGADSSYLATYLQSPIGQERMLADSGGSTIKHLYISKLAGMSTPWPEENEMNAIVSRISGMTARLENEESLLSKLNRQKSGVMDDLLTGRVHVTLLLESFQHAAPTEV
ncbi:restriction endonuclease subunit S [Pseudomonas sp. OA65]|uniref:restriction endonuclease subunit S n=1 Tax=Pseudomonas sp. OA65 TaxID=2818431 RepID=UPI001A9E91EE|nr:restriction endonuclease subunit S [Pseudomonas sp. OA65]MBO1540470.1 restriction endonuclease subunit S [Pseudomonas sp. OA65]